MAEPDANVDDGTSGATDGSEPTTDDGSSTTDDGSSSGSSSSSSDSTDDTTFKQPLGVKSTEKFSVPEEYREIWNGWSQQHGMLKVKPEVKFYYNTKVTGDQKSDKTDKTIDVTSVSYINNDKSTQPVTQVFPIQNLNVTPHFTNFTFYEGGDGNNYGIQQATYQPMIVECDVTFSALLLYYYNYANYAKEYTGASQWMGLEAIKNADGHGMYYFDEAEKSEQFVNIRQRFLQEYSGWACTFSSTAFGTFQGVFTEIKYKIEEGDTDAVYSIKIEEVIITDDLKNSNTDTTTIGSQSTEVTGTTTYNNSAYNFEPSAEYADEGESNSGYVVSRDGSSLFIYPTTLKQ
jgi:hypothetical protein